MKIRKAIKKIVALGTGVTMLGATIFGAAAADLGNFPSPMFIENGAFNGVIVVGDGAAASDVVGSIDVATSMQYSSTTTTQVSTGGTAVAPSVSEGLTIQKSGDKFNMNETIYDFATSGFDDADLPVVLADGTYEDNEGNQDNTETYTQVLKFLDHKSILTFDNDDDGDETADVYLRLEDNSVIYNYTLAFDSEIDYDNTSDTTAANDFETTTIEFQGSTYTFSDVDLTGAHGTIKKIKLLAGETTMWMEEGVTYTKSVAGVEHTVVLQDVNEDQDKCGITVDGTLAWVNKGSTKTINGVEVGVTDAISVHSEAKTEDACRVDLGAAELLLEDGKKIEKDGADVDGSKVYLSQSKGGKFGGFYIEYEAQDEENLAEGNTWIDPVFGNWELKFGGLVGTYTTVEATGGGLTGEVKFMNNDGKEVTIYYHNATDNHKSTAFWLGKDEDELLLTSEEHLNTEVKCDNRASPSTAADACEGTMFLMIDSGETAHLMEIADIDEDDNKTDIYDITYGVTYNDKTIVLKGRDAVNNVTDKSTISLGSLGTIDLWLNRSGYIIVRDIDLSTDDVGAELQGTDDAHIKFYDLKFNLTEGDDESKQQSIGVAWSYDASNKDMEMSSKPSMTGPEWNTGSTWKDLDDNDDDTQYAMTEQGTKIAYDNDEKQKVTFEVPYEQVYGSIFLSPVGAQLVGGATSDGDTITVTTTTPIPVGTAKLASEIADVTAVNAIVIGGPCANAAAATLTGVAGTVPECLAGLDLAGGEAVIKLYAQAGGKVSMLVAGATADDTRRACRVLANADQYSAQLTGTEVRVTGTTMTDITVSAPTAG